MVALRPSAVVVEGEWVSFLGLEPFQEAGNRISWLEMNHENYNHKFIKCSPFGMYGVGAS